MEQSPNVHRTSRASKLPIPNGSALRQQPSKEFLGISNSITVPRLRGSVSRDQLSSARDRDASTGTVIYTPSKSHTPSNSRNGTVSRKSPGFRCKDRAEPHARIDSTQSAQQLSKELKNVDSIKQRKARPSLSERTMETLSQLPPSPAVRKRHSSFFRTENPMRPPSQGNSDSRPGSSYRADISMEPPLRSVSSRPSSSSGYKRDAALSDFRASTNTFRPSRGSNAETPVKRQSIITPQKKPLRVKSSDISRSNETPSKLPPAGNISSSLGMSPSANRNADLKRFTKPESKTVSAKPLRSRSSVSSIFRKPSMPELTTNAGSNREVSANIPLQNIPITISYETPNITKSSHVSASDIEKAKKENPPPRKSSLALREQIAKARAAKRVVTARRASGAHSEATNETPLIPAGTFDFGLGDDPFNQRTDKDEAKGLLRKRIDSARTDGRLNIAAMGLREIPPEVLNMYNFEVVTGQGSSWAESVDLTRLVAANNELETLGDNVFPDIDPKQLLDDEDVKGNQFCGLETLDLHGNSLKIVPPGLRRLQVLTTLNLSNNKLDDDCFDVISQIKTLRDLKIGSNNLSGQLSTSIAKLENLEILDVQRNSLTSLPAAVIALTRLRVLNLTENHFTSLPFEILQQLPIIELSAAKNRLEGILVAIRDVELRHLQVLDVVGNSLTSLTSGQLSLPSLHQLNCSANRLTSLPDMAAWKSLLTLAAEDNNISFIPDGFVSLEKLKTVDLSGNNLVVLDDRIGNMESLDILRISGNPLREKKFSGMATEDLKRAFRARLTPVEANTGSNLSEVSDPETSATSSPSRSTSSDWPVKAGGVLDRSNTQSYSLNPVIVAQISANHTIRTLELHHNIFKEIPSSIGFFVATLTTLNMAHNELTSDTFIKDDLELPVLKELNISSNTFNSLRPLVQRLKAPQLEKLDISFNRLTFLPELRPHYPRLTVLLASHNTIRELSPEAVKGLKVLDCSSNDISSLNPRIGLLGGPGGLERLDVSGNRFRVPKYTVLEKGTEAVLAWLRDRIPAGETNSIETE